jgi:formate hydrogenlyase subunit 6/NADH:ubiquinone oxidoreductase subunit I
MNRHSYLGGIADVCKTVLDGMAVTFSHLVRKPSTVQYPDRMAVRVQDTLPFRYRGILEVDLEICTGCLACERACPIDCIVIDAKKDPQVKGIVMTRFDIDMAKCMYCGLCSEPCPTGAIHHTPEFEGADFALESLIRRFVKDPVVAYKPKKAGEDDPQLKEMLDRGLCYVEEFASPAGASPAAASPTGASPTGAGTEATKPGAKENAA